MPARYFGRKSGSFIKYEIAIRAHRKKRVRILYTESPSLGVSERKLYTAPIGVHVRPFFSFQRKSFLLLYNYNRWCLLSLS